MTVISDFWLMQGVGRGGKNMTMCATPGHLKVADLKEKLELTEALLKRRADWIETKNRELNVYRSVIDECKRCTRSYAKRWMVLEGLKVEFPAVSTD